MIDWGKLNQIPADVAMSCIIAVQWIKIKQTGKCTKSEGTKTQQAETEKRKVSRAGSNKYNKLIVGKQNMTKEILD